MEDDNTQDMIDRYLRGQMTLAEQQEFLGMLEKDSELKQELELQKLLFTGINTYGNNQLKRKLGQIHQQEIGDSKEKVQRSPKIIAMRRIVAIAAAFLIFISAYFLIFQKSHNERLYASYFEPYDISLTTRGGAADEMLQTAASYYEDASYEDALKTIHTYLSNKDATSQVLLMKGICEMELDKNDDALNTFSSLIQLNDPLYNDHAQCYSSHTNLKTGNKEHSRLHLQQ